MDILPLDYPVDEHYGDIRAHLNRTGHPIGWNDLFIAAHARSLGLILVTDNIREFSRVPGLSVENWLANSNGFSLEKMRPVDFFQTAEAKQFFPSARDAVPDNYLVSGKVKVSARRVDISFCAAQ